MKWKEWAACFLALFVLCAGLIGVATGLLGRASTSAGKGLEARYTENFPLSGSLLDLRTHLDHFIGKREANDVYIADDRMLDRSAIENPELLSQNYAKFESFANAYQSVPKFMLILPTSSDIFESSYPLVTNRMEDMVSVNKEFSSIMTVFETSKVLYSARDEYIYYRTDTRLTSLGNFYVYRSIAKNLGFTPLTQDAFNIIYLDHDFRGTLYYKSYDTMIEPDSIVSYRVVGKDPVVSTLTYLADGTIKGNDSIYYPSKLDGKEKIEYFLGDPAPLVRIQTAVNNGKRLLLIKGSQSSGIVPFLVNHYQTIDMVDLSLLNDTVLEATGLKEELGNYTQILFTYGYSELYRPIAVEKLLPAQ